MLNEIIHGDCLQVMKEIPDKSIDLIVTDPPYNIGKAEWDKIDNYVEWMGTVFLECQRVLKDNGSFYWFHNDFEQMAELQVWLKKNTRFVFNSFITWDKGDFRALAWKNPSEESNLRSWFGTSEYCLFYTFQDETGLTTVMLDTNNFPTMRKYFKDLQEWIGLGLKKINERLGHRKAEHAFYWKTTQWDMPTEKTYNQLIEEFLIDKWDGFKEYESLRQEYESLRYTHNLDPNHNNVWRLTTKNTGKRHVCEKPVELMERIIKCSSNDSDTILDPFIGSGTTAIASLNTGRFFIGIEKDEHYYQVATNRVQEWHDNRGLFT